MSASSSPTAPRPRADDDRGHRRRDRRCRARRPALAATAGTALLSGLAAVTLPVGARAGRRRGRTPGPLRPSASACWPSASWPASRRSPPLPSAFAAWARCRAGLARVAEVLAAHRLPSTEPTTPCRRPGGARPRRAPGSALRPRRRAPAVVLSDADLRSSRPVAHRGGRAQRLRARARCSPPTMRLLSPTGRRSTDRPARPGRDLVACAPQRPAAAGRRFAAGRPRLRRHPARQPARRATRRRPTTTRRVAARVRAGRFVRALPAGWSTPAGPDGAALSGGQRQRLLLARALLADPARSWCWTSRPPTSTPRPTRGPRRPAGRDRRPHGPDHHPPPAAGRPGRRHAAHRLRRTGARGRSRRGDEHRSADPIRGRVPRQR